MCVVVLFSCKKEAKDPVYVSMRAVQAHSDTPVEGIKWTIQEFKGTGAIVSWNVEPTDFKLTGQTDANGISIIELHPKKDKDYSYSISFDYTTMKVPSGDYSIVFGPTTFANLVRESPNHYEIRILPKMDVQFNFKNENCFDSNDTFRYKSFNIDEQPNLNQNQINSTPWLEGTSLNGCVDFVGPFATRLAGHYVFYWEATRNGILETGIDTFYVSPGVNDLIEMHW